MSGEQPERVRLALEHPCPRCKAPAQAGCTRPNGTWLADDKVHKAREDIAARLTHDDGPPASIATNGGRVCWRDYADSLRERGDWTPGNRRLLLSAIRWSEEAEAALERAAETPECIGSTGQAVANPQFQVAARAQEKQLAALTALRLTPASAFFVPVGGKLPGERGDELDDLERTAPAGGSR
jgi:hypothetical protein